MSNDMKNRHEHTHHQAPHHNGHDDHHHDHGHDHDHDHDHAHGHGHHHHHASQTQGRKVRKQWRSLSEMAEQPGFEELLEKEYPRQAAAFAQGGFDRRTFLKLMGSALALVGVNGCTTRPPAEQVIPYVQNPEELVPGRPVFYASTLALGGFGSGVLIETHEGRPLRLEGNPRHPATLGASDVFIQAAILDMYNPDRSTIVTQQGTPATWEEFTAAWSAAMAALPADGSGLAVLTESTSSPTLLAQLAALQAKYSGARWYQHDPVQDGTVEAGARMAFDRNVNTVYRLAAADVILTLDADLLGTMPGSLRYAREFAERRRVRTNAGPVSMSRVYAVECTPTTTGSVADHRLPLRPSEIELFARALAQALGVSVGGSVAEIPWDAAWFDGVVADLQANPGRSLVAVGRQQPPVVQALGHAINAALGNVGATVVYTEPVLSEATADLRALVQDSATGAVQALLILGGNPVYTAPADVDLAGALATMPFSAHLSLFQDETSAVTTWHLPQTHFVEEWSDARSYDGAASIVQPPISPLYEAVRSAHEVLALALEDTRDGYEIVRSTWEGQLAAEDFEAAWGRALNLGVIENSSFAPVDVAVRGDFAAALPATPSAASGLEVIFRPDAKLWDGRFAGNSWLLELPAPITKLCWDNAALVSPTTAVALGVNTESVIALDVAGRTLDVPVWVLPGQADDVITLSLGYGHTAGAEVGIGAGFNAYALRPSTGLWQVAGATAAATAGTYKLVTTQRRYEADLGDPIQVVTLQQYMEDPEHLLHTEHHAPISLLQEFVYDDYAWGMAIDLNACIGCNACVLACQTENNIPTVGKDQIGLSREMYWLRVDRYYEGELENPKTYFQPVPCMQCENAPCEVVCPVQATVHSDEGLNQMVYNRCVGTRYCSANCPYGVRRFNFKNYVDDAGILIDLRNPDVTVRPKGVMEKCTYCTQRISAARIAAKVEGRTVHDGEIVPACAGACPTQAIVFGDMNDANSRVAQLKAQPQHYPLLGDIQTKPRTTYLARFSNPNEAIDGTES